MRLSHEPIGSPALTQSGCIAHHRAGGSLESPRVLLGPCHLDMTCQFKPHPGLTPPADFSTSRPPVHRRLYPCLQPGPSRFRTGLKILIIPIFLVEGALRAPDRWRRAMICMTACSCVASRQQSSRRSFVFICSRRQRQSLYCVSMIGETATDEGWLPADARGADAVFQPHVIVGGVVAGGCPRA